MLVFGSARRRETKGERRAGPGPIFQDQLAPHPLRQLPADRQPQAEAGLARGVRSAVEALEDGLALLVRDGQIASVEKVTARGREAPLLPTLALAKSSMDLAASETV